MPECEFEEKEYEVQMTIELARPPAGRRYLAPAGQYIEKLLGYDAAADPAANDPIWRAIDAPRPSGVRLLPPMFASHPRDQPAQVRLPTEPVSLLVQFKRPYRIARRRGQTPPEEVPVPVFRVEVEIEQQAVLRRLEASLASSALVRYAAPAFHTVPELERARLQNNAVDRSSYVAPSAIDLHTYWYYEGAGSGGWANPGLEELLLEDSNALFGRLNEAATSAPTAVRGAREHIRALAKAIRSADNSTELLVDRWIADVVDSTSELSDDLLDRLRELASISTFAARRNLAWFLMSGSIN